MSENEAVLNGSETVEQEALTPAETIATLGAMIKALEQTDPKQAKVMAKGLEAIKSKIDRLSDVVEPYDEEKLFQTFDQFIGDYMDKENRTEILLVRGSSVYRMNIERDNMYLTPTGLKKILQPAREGSAAKNPQALAITLKADGTFDLEPSHAGVDWKDHFATKWQ